MVPRSAARTEGRSPGNHRSARWTIFALASHAKHRTNQLLSSSSSGSCFFLLPPRHDRGRPPAISCRISLQWWHICTSVCEIGSGTRCGPAVAASGGRPGVGLVVANVDDREIVALVDRLLQPHRARRRRRGPRCAAGQRRAGGVLLRTRHARAGVAMRGRRARRRAVSRSRTSLNNVRGRGGKDADKAVSSAVGQT